MQDVYDDKCHNSYTVCALHLLLEYKLGGCYYRYILQQSLLWNEETCLWGGIAGTPHNAHIIDRIFSKGGKTTS